MEQSCNAPSHDSGDSDSEGEAPIAAQVWTPVTRVGDVGGMGGSVRQTSRLRRGVPLP